MPWATVPFLAMAGFAGIRRSESFQGIRRGPGLEVGFSHFPLLNTDDADTIFVVLRSANESTDTGFVLTPPAQRSHNLGVDYHRRYH